MRRLIVGVVMVVVSGCSGVELGLKTGIYRVDERQESQRTHRQAVPWKCYFTNCGEPKEVEGS